MMSNLIKNFLYILFVSTLTQSCFIAKPIETAQIKKKFTEKENVMPPEFGKNGTVLVLMLENKNIYDNYLKKVFKNIYKGEFVSVDKTNLSLKYKDRNKYRYFFTYGSSANTRLNNNSLKEYYIFDRIEGKKYSFNEEISFTRNALNTYAEILEEKRLSMK